MAGKVLSAKPNAKTALLAKIAASSGLSNKQVTAVLDALANQIKHSLDTIGTITILNLVKIEKKTVATCPTWPAYIKATVLPELLPGPDAYCAPRPAHLPRIPGNQQAWAPAGADAGDGVSGLGDTGLVQGCCSMAKSGISRAGWTRWRTRSRSDSDKRHCGGAADWTSARSPHQTEASRGSGAGGLQHGPVLSLPPRWRPRRAAEVFGVHPGRRSPRWRSWRTWWAAGASGRCREGQKAE